MSNFSLEFIGIGAARAGTTWLAQCLSEHPQVCLCAQKEANFFCTKHMWPQHASNRVEGLRWLEARFLHWEEGQIRGEISPSYLVDPDSPSLIHSFSPYINIVVSYRNPTDSLYSLYHQFAKNRNVPSTFEGFLDEYPDFIEYGFYYTHTRCYLESFPLDSFHFIIFDDICQDPLAVVADLYRFLGVEVSYRPPSLYRRVNERMAPRSVAVRDTIGKAREYLNSSNQALRVRRMVRRLGLSRIGEWVEEKNLQAGHFPPMNQDTRVRLQKIYAEENVALAELLGRDLSHWNE